MAIAGNTSSNFDDSYMARICNVEQKDVFLETTDIIIDKEDRSYIANDYLVSGGVEIKGASEVVFRSGREILITTDVGGTFHRTFTVDHSSHFHAYIDPALGGHPDEESGDFLLTNRMLNDIDNDPYNVSKISHNKSDIEVFPNPFTGSIALKIDGDFSGEAAIYIHNPTGYLGRKEKSVVFSNGFGQLNISTLPSGMYLLSIDLYSGSMFYDPIRVVKR